MTDINSYEYASKCKTITDTFIVDIFLNDFVKTVKKMSSVCAARLIT